MININTETGVLPVPGKPIAIVNHKSGASDVPIVVSGTVDFSNTEIAVSPKASTTWTVAMPSTLTAASTPFTGSVAALRVTTAKVAQIDPTDASPKITDNAYTHLITDAWGRLRVTDTGTKTVKNTASTPLYVAPGTGVTFAVSGITSAVGLAAGSNVIGKVALVSDGTTLTLSGNTLVVASEQKGIWNVEVSNFPSSFKVTDGTETLAINTDGSINTKLLAGDYIIGKVKLLAGDGTALTHSSGVLNVRATQATNPWVTSLDVASVSAIASAFPSTIEVKNGSNTLSVDASGYITTRLASGTNRIGEVVVRGKNGSSEVNLACNATGALKIVPEESNMPVSITSATFSNSNLNVQIRNGSTSLALDSSGRVNANIVATASSTDTPSATTNGSKVDLKTDLNGRLLVKDVNQYYETRAKMLNATATGITPATSMKSVSMGAGINRALIKHIVVVQTGSTASSTLEIFENSTVSEGNCIYRYTGFSGRLDENIDLYYNCDANNTNLYFRIQGGGTYTVKFKGEVMA